MKNHMINTKIYNDQVAFFYLGQEGFLLKFRSTTLLIDPYLSDYVDRNCSTPGLLWKRNYAPPILPGKLDFIDYVFCTHDHYDHMDPTTLFAIHQANSNTKFIIPKATAHTMLSYGIPAANIICASSKKQLSFPDFSVLPLPSAHESLTTNKDGEYLHLGYRFHFANTTVYHAGDCCIYDGLAHNLLNTDILMLPINGRGFYKVKDDIIGNMDFQEALLLAKETSAKMIIPMHYDLYNVNGINPSYFVDLLYREFSNLCFHMFIPGEKYIFSP